MVSFFKSIKLRFVAYLTLSLNLWPSFRTTSYELIPHYQFTGLKNRTGTILMLNTSITLHHLEAKLMLYIQWENPSPLFTGLVTIYIYIYLHLHAGYSFQRKYYSSSYLHYSITLNIKETVHIYLFLFTFFLRGIIDIVRIQCKA